MSRRNRPHLYILRGLPGSGKSELAREIMEDYGDSGVILSTDDYFNDDGVMDFNYQELNIAHQWNRYRACEAMEDGMHPIIIDNTNMRLCEMKPYVKMGLDNGYYIKLKTTPDTWACTVKELHKRTYGTVPLWVMYRMKKSYEPAYSIFDILKDTTNWN